MQSHLLSRTKRIDGKKMRESWGGQRESRICLDYCCPLSANTPPQLQACSGPHSSQARGEGGGRDSLLYVRRERASDLCCVQGLLGRRFSVSQWVSEWSNARWPRCVQEPPKSFQINNKWAWSKGFLPCCSFCIDYSLDWVSSYRSLWMGDCEIWNHQSRILELEGSTDTSGLLLSTISAITVLALSIHVSSLLLLLTFFYQLTYFLKIQVNILKILTPPSPHQNLFFRHLSLFLVNGGSFVLAGAKVWNTLESPLNPL